MWTDTAGLSGNLSVSVTDIHYDAQETRAYYGHDVAPATVMAGDVKSPKAADLLQALPS
jgi:lipid-binding SYLF domain-containing protein